MVDTLKQFNLKNPGKDYSFGKVTSVSGAKITVQTTSGLKVSINDSFQEYKIGDQVALAARNGNLNSMFVIRKMKNIFPASGTVLVIGPGQG
ncbi:MULTISPECIES: hypothetical protein [Desulfobacula]|uniref:Uncharacterized protein n=2 Tax=Desulfobacula TaxID=28222 RepID=K0NAP3_DESTT|nr:MULTISPECIES: hypothetical protein [Desulfobacula]CCK81184.1 uncharacterized protein TOL2_C30250 [Desulfobacula toluolica Tol2]SDU38074.1 hypothetical protein SAMN04487931_107183 [Desulfobacula phenolica]